MGTQRFLALTLATSLTISLAVNAASAAESPTPPLAPGKPAGVHQADIWDLKSLAVIGGGAILVVGFALLISDGSVVTTQIPAGIGNSSVFTPTTTTSK
jgi:hypothetical protein